MTRPGKLCRARIRILGQLSEQAVIQQLGWLPLKDSVSVGAWTESDWTLIRSDTTASPCRRQVTSAPSSTAQSDLWGNPRSSAHGQIARAQGHCYKAKHSYSIGYRVSLNGSKLHCRLVGVEGADRTHHARSQSRRWQRTADDKFRAIRSTLRDRDKHLRVWHVVHFAIVRVGNDTDTQGFALANA